MMSSPARPRSTGCNCRTAEPCLHKMGVLSSLRVCVWSLHRVEARGKHGESGIKCRENISIQIDERAFFLYSRCGQSFVEFAQSHLDEYFSNLVRSLLGVASQWSSDYFVFFFFFSYSAFYWFCVPQKINSHPHVSEFLFRPNMFCIRSRSRRNETTDKKKLNFFSALTHEKAAEKRPANCLKKSENRNVAREVRSNGKSKLRRMNMNFRPRVRVFKLEINI